MPPRTFRKVLTAADRNGRISIPAILRDGLFPDVDENSKTPFLLVDEKDNSYGMVLKVRKNKTKPEFMSKGGKKFINKRNLLPGNFLDFFEGESRYEKRVRVLDPPGSICLAPPQPPAPAEPGSPVGAGHEPLEPPTAPPVVLGDGPSAAPVALGLSLINGSDQAPPEPPSVLLELKLGLRVAAYSPGEALGSTKAEVQEEGPALQVLGQPPAFSQDQPTAERAAALSLPLASIVMPPPITVQGPPADLSLSPKASLPELLKPPATALFLGPTEAACLVPAHSEGLSFLAMAGSYELEEPKPPILPPPAARQYFSAFRFHSPLKPKPRRSTAPYGAPVARFAEEHAAGLHFSAAGLDVVPVATAPKSLVDPQMARGAGLISFSTPFKMRNEPQEPSELVGTRILDRIRPLAAGANSAGSNFRSNGGAWDSTGRLHAAGATAEHLQEKQAPANMKLFGFFIRGL